MLIVATVHKMLLFEYATTTNYESFDIDKDECSKEEPGIKTQSLTECLLHCEMGKCKNSMIDKNQTCYCTEQKCAMDGTNIRQKIQQNGITFLTSKLNFRRSTFCLDSPHFWRKSTESRAFVVHSQCYVFYWRQFNDFFQSFFKQSFELPTFLSIFCRLSHRTEARQIVGHLN